MKRILAALFCLTIVHAQPGTIATVVGAYPEGDGGPAAKAALVGPQGLAFDKDGSLYVVDNMRVRRILPDGRIMAFACSGIRGFSGDNGPATLAQCQSSSAVVVDPTGNVFFSDRRNNRVRKISPNGIITTAAGTGTAGFSGDGGPAQAARLTTPTSMAVAPDGTLYIADDGNGRIRKLTPDGIISTLAGSGPVNPGSVADSGDGGPALVAQFDSIDGLLIGPGGDLYVADNGSYRIRRISSDGIIHLVAGAGPPRGFSGDGGPARLARFNGVAGMAFDSQGRLVVQDNTNNRIRRIGLDGIITTIAGNGRRADDGDGGLATVATINPTPGIVIDKSDNIYFSSGFFVRRVDPAGLITTVAGVPLDAGAKGSPVYARSVTPQDVVFDAQGLLIFADATNVRKLASDGSLAMVAGTGFRAGSIAGQPATQTAFYDPGSVAFDAEGNLYVTDLVQQFIGKIGSDNILRVVTGVTGRDIPGSYSGDGGAAAQAGVFSPLQMATDRAGNLYFADSGNHRVRRISSDGKIDTVAGNGQAGFSGDNGPATATQLNNPNGVALDSAGNLYIGDTNNHRVRRVSPSGAISTIAGSGQTGFADGAALSARIQNPRRLALDAAGNLYVTDGTNRVRKISASGIVSTVAGNGTRGFSGDGGSAAQAALNNPTGIAFDANGNLYIADSDNNRIRRVQGSTPFNAAPTSLVFAYALGASPVTQSLIVSSPDGEPRTFQVASSVSWLAVSPQTGDATSPVKLAVTASPAGLGKGTYGAQLRIVDSGGSATVVPVTMTISGSAQQMRLSQVGLTFTALQGGPAPSAQTFQVLNTGIGTMPWSAAASTFAGNPTWLSATPASGSTIAGSTAPLLTVSANPAGFAAGSYYGQITVTSASADNSPQVAIVLLNVLPADGTPGPQVDPSGLLFTAVPGANPAVQSVELANPSTRTINYTASVRLTNGTGWLTAPAAGSLTTGQRRSIDIQPRGQSLAAGVYRATITFTFTPDNVTRTVDVALVLSAGGTANAVKTPGAAAEGCAAKQLVSVIRKPGAGYQTAAGWPVPLEAAVVDDCGVALQQGRVVATFSSNDPQLTLLHTGNGIWQGTWASRTTQAATNVTITVGAQNAEQTLTGQTQVAIRSNLNPDQPSIAPGGVLNAASFVGDTPLSPGEYVSVFGARLAKQFQAAGTLPLPALLGETIVSLGGKVAPLHFASDGQVNAILPYNIADNTTHQMIVRVGSIPSLPEAVVVGSVQPAVFSADGTGKGQGHIYGVTPEGFLVLADNARPVKPGDVVVIYATGLGPVNLPVVDGAAAPSGPFALPVNKIGVTIQGKNAAISFAGLAPEYAGVYQINAQIPADVEPDSAAPLIVTAGEQPSPVVTLAITIR